MTPAPHRYAVFLDIDGTLLTREGLVPPSAATAVHGARANGHLVFLATGRSLNEIPDEVRAIGFDGVVAATGGHVELADGRVLLDRRIDPDAARTAIALLMDLAVPHFVQTPDGLTGTPDAPTTLRRLLLDGHEGRLAARPDVDTFLDAIATPTRADAGDAADKIVFLDAGARLTRIRRELSRMLTVAPPSVPWFGSGSGELTAPGVHKGTAVALVLAAVGLPPAAAIAFGDSANDVEMLSTVGTGIAMADGSPLAHAAAGRLTEAAHHDGIAKAFSRLGLLGGGGEV